MSCVTSFTRTMWFAQPIQLDQRTQLGIPDTRKVPGSDINGQVPRFQCFFIRLMSALDAVKHRVKVSHKCLAQHRLDSVAFMCAHVTSRTDLLLSCRMHRYTRTPCTWLLGERGGDRAGRKEKTHLPTIPRKAREKKHDLWAGKAGSGHVTNASVQHVSSCL